MRCWLPERSALSHGVYPRGRSPTLHYLKRNRRPAGTTANAKVVYDRNALRVVGYVTGIQRWRSGSFRSFVWGIATTGRGAETPGSRIDFIGFRAAKRASE